MSCFGCFSFRRSAFKKESTSVAARAVTGKSPGEFYGLSTLLKEN